MQQILFFFIRNKNFLLFCALFTLSLALTINSHSYHKNKFVNSANFLSGGLYSAKSNVTDYFDLDDENKKLVEENIRLREQLEIFKWNATDLKIDSSSIVAKYTFVPARVINNSYSKTNNLLTLNKGARQNLKIDMGVISSKGIVGIINKVSNNYATVQSILNTNSEINAKLKNSDHFGSLVWDMEKPNVVQLIEIPRLTPIAVGDTIITGGRSTIFPEGIAIGTIKDFELSRDESSFKLNVDLFNDMTNLGQVYVIENKEKEEIKALELNPDDAE